MAVVLDRTLSPSPDTLLSRSWRIKHEDSDVEMLSLEDFDLDDGYVDEDQGLDSMKVRQNALLCIEKATLCWRSDRMSCYQSSGDFPIHSDSASCFARQQKKSIYPAAMRAQLQATVSLPQPDGAATTRSHRISSRQLLKLKF
jgi:hypothetical protein